MTAGRLHYLAQTVFRAKTDLFPPDSPYRKRIQYRLRFNDLHSKRLNEYEIHVASKLLTIKKRVGGRPREEHITGAKVCGGGASLRPFSTTSEHGPRGNPGGCRNSRSIVKDLDPTPFGSPFGSHRLFSVAFLNQPLGAAERAAINLPAASINSSAA